MGTENDTSDSDGGGDFETKLRSVLEKLLPEVVLPQIEAHQAAFAKKINGEMAGFRKQLTGQRETRDAGDGSGADVKAKPGPEVTPKALGEADIEARFAQLEKLRDLKSKVGAEKGKAIMEALGEGPTIADQVRAFSVAALYAASETDGEGAKRRGGETPGINRGGARTGTQAQRSNIARPASKAEWKAMKIEDKRKLFDADAEFDPDTLT